MESAARGFTLLELIVVLVLMGVVAGVSALGVASLRLPESGELIDQVTAARAESARTGLAVTLHLRMREDSAPRVLRFLPDGRAMGRGLDPLTGRWMEDSE